MLRRSQMKVEELQRALPRQTRGLRLVIFALVAIKAVARVINEQRQVRMRCPDLFDFRWPDMRLFGSEVHHHGTARRLRGIGRYLPTVITDCRSRVETRGSKPRQTASIAKSQ